MPFFPPPSPKKRKQRKKRRGVDACVGRLPRVKTVNRRAKPLKAAEEASGWRFFEILRHGGLSRHGRLGLPAFRRQRFSQAGPKTKSARGAPQSIGLTAQLGAGGAKADLPPPKSLGLFPRARCQAQAAWLRRAARRLGERYWGAVSLSACSFFSPVLTFRRPPALLFPLLFASFSFFTFFTFFFFLPLSLLLFSLLGLFFLPSLFPSCSHFAPCAFFLRPRIFGWLYLCRLPCVSRTRRPIACRAGGENERCGKMPGVGLAAGGPSCALRRARLDCGLFREINGGVEFRFLRRAFWLSIVLSRLGGSGPRPSPCRGGEGMAAARSDRRAIRATEITAL